MNSNKLPIGFSQRVRLQWFEQTTNLILAGNDKNAINEALQVTLCEKISVGSRSARGNRERIITILMKTWLNVPFELKPLRNEGLALLQHLADRNRIAIHWSMISAVYPFWGSVAAHTGRLLRLQGTVGATHVQRRIKEDYGERENASRAARRVLRSFIDWCVLNDTPERGIYDQGCKYSIDEPRLIAWMVEASLHARVNGAAPIRDLLESPNNFPFRLPHVSAEQLASQSPRLDVFRHGLDDELVMLCDESRVKGK